MLTQTRALPRRLLIATTGLALAAASLTAVATPAFAATTNVTVTGTSDVYDSGLVQAVIGPDFQQAYPQYKLNYISEGTGKAITDAENGVADALIVHAPSLENAFVAGNGSGVSYSQEGPGRAIFWGDYIFAGATSDPANVDPAYPTPAHDIVQSFEDVATAGAAGNANFVSRGGTPGTTVQEHAIWALTTGVPLCSLSATANSGGGSVPSTTANPDGTCPSAGPTYPSWYHVTGLTQGPNIVNANQCSYSTTGNNCYVFTDRGTFDYLQSGSTVQAGNLKLLVRDNDASAPGGGTLLVNTFHAYVVNPNAVAGGSSLNTAGATALLDWITSDAGQTAIGNYLQGNADGAPFIPDAAPQVTVDDPPAVVNGGAAVTLTGSVANVVPGTPALSGVQVQVLGRPAATPKAAFTPVTAGTTDSSGDFSIPFTPTVNETYKLFTPALPDQFEYTENPGPDFSDALQSTTTTVGAIDVKGTFVKENASTTKGHLKVTGSVNPVRTGNNAYLSLYARPAGSTAAFTYHGRHQLAAGSHGFSATYVLPKGRWQFHLNYNNAGVINSGTSANKTVTVG